MVTLPDLADYTNSLLKIDSFKDYCPNGLQVEGRAEVKTLVSGVTASMALIQAAIDVNADAILVHHGYFWRGENPVITGMKRSRLRALLDNEISLLAYHLPLDAHLEYGNNATLAAHLGFHIDGVVSKGRAKDILFYGRLADKSDPDTLIDHISDRLGNRALLIRAGDKEVQCVAWCTGGAQGYIEEALTLGVDAYISGEISEQTTHVARESGMHFIAAGHHATERYGPASLGQHLADHFGLEHHFIDIDNPA